MLDILSQSIRHSWWSSWHYRDSSPFIYEREWGWGWGFIERSSCIILRVSKGARLLIKIDIIGYVIIGRLSFHKCMGVCVPVDVFTFLHYLLKSGYWDDVLRASSTANSLASFSLYPGKWPASHVLVVSGKLSQGFGWFSDLGGVFSGEVLLKFYSSTGCTASGIWITILTWGKKAMTAFACGSN